MSLKRARESTSTGKKEPDKKVCVQASVGAITTLPAVCLALLFSFLDAADNFLSLRRVCREFNRVAQLPMSFAPTLDTSLFSERSVATLFTHLPRQYSPRVAKLYTYQPALIATLPSLNTSKTETLTLTGSHRDISLGLWGHLKEWNAFLASSSSNVKHFISTSLNRHLLCDLLTFLGSDQCRWKLSSLILSDGWLRLEDEFRHIFPRLLSASSLSTLEALDMSHLPLDTDSKWEKGIAQHWPLLRTLSIRCEGFDEEDMLAPLFRGLSRLETLTLRLGNLTWDCLEPAILNIDTSSLQSLTSLTIHCRDHAFLTWRTIAHLCSAPRLSGIYISGANSEPEPFFSDSKEGREAKAKDMAISQQLVAACRPVLQCLCLKGDVKALFRQIMYFLPQLGQSLQTLEICTELPRDKELFVQLGQQFRQLRNLRLSVDAFDEDIEQLSNIPSLTSLNLVSEYGVRMNQMTEKSLPAFFRMKNLKTVKIGRQSRLDTLAVRAEFAKRRIELIPM